ncbi:hypothetical protein PBY51_010945 [Eleginops maclovinus]|uniref:Uncharacterized protein n=1 Tax=Eleginops maclovinus TaxID=56733 RepID=A0AAN7XCM9_ELEMC|nr:hypothetical protein PBY51_010945 [Eleginops maclovinus]
MGKTSLCSVSETCGTRLREVVVEVVVVVVVEEMEFCWSGLEGWSWSGVRPSCCGLLIHSTAPEVVVEAWMS